MTASQTQKNPNQQVITLDKLGKDDVEIVGGKNASLGEMISHLADLGVSVPGGFATTAEAFNRFLNETGLLDKINNELNVLDVDDVNALTAKGKNPRLGHWPRTTCRFGARNSWCLRWSGGDDIAVAVRSSATAEDLPDASFAGQQETYLNIRGIDNVLIAIKEVFASLYNDRAIAYRVHQGFEHAGVALSAGIQRMVRSETGASGVMFTIDTESGFDEVVFITASYGLGEMVVQGAVNPDEYYLSKKLLEEGNLLSRRNLGSKHQKMVYGDDGSTAKSTKIVDVDMAQRRQFALSTSERNELAKQALISKNTTVKRWTLSGQKMAIRAIFLSYSPSWNGQKPSRPQRHGAISNQQQRRQGALWRTLNWSTGLCGRSASGWWHFWDGQGARRRRTCVRHDRPRLGTRQKRASPSSPTEADAPVMPPSSLVSLACQPSLVVATLQSYHEGKKSPSSAEGDTGFIYEGILDFNIQSNSIDAMPDLPFKIMMNVRNPTVRLPSLKFQMLALAGSPWIHHQPHDWRAPQSLAEHEPLPVDVTRAIEDRIAGIPRLWTFMSINWWRYLNFSGGIQR